MGMKKKEENKLLGVIISERPENLEAAKWWEKAGESLQKAERTKREVCIWIIIALASFLFFLLQAMVAGILTPMVGSFSCGILAASIIFVISYITEINFSKLVGILFLAIFLTATLYLAVVSYFSSLSWIWIAFLGGSATYTGVFLGYNIYSLIEKKEKRHVVS
ncbi:MAG: hypothetical protein QME59_08080 [Candidatus Hydrothermarchaeota archaeon]|nr:hypothetical protein [Candidatus Hydrothermarchaeota archaeon]